MQGVRQPKNEADGTQILGDEIFADASENGVGVGSSGRAAAGTFSSPAHTKLVCAGVKTCKQ